MCALDAARSSLLGLSIAARSESIEPMPKLASGSSIPSVSSLGPSTSSTITPCNQLSGRSLPFNASRTWFRTSEVESSKAELS